jgi:hypothetical protein
MMAVPRRPKRAAGQKVVIPTNGTHTPPPGPTEPVEHGAPKPGPPASADANVLQPPAASAAGAAPPAQAADAASGHALQNDSPNASPVTPSAPNGKAPAQMTSHSVDTAEPSSSHPVKPSVGDTSPMPDAANSAHQSTPDAPGDRRSIYHIATPIVGAAPRQSSDASLDHTITDVTPDVSPATPTTATGTPRAELAKTDREGPRLAPDPGLYAVLGLSPSASDAEIQTNYRRQAARLLNNGSNNTHAMRELNVAYEVLGNPARREEYDRARGAQSLTQGPPTPIRGGAKVAARVTRRTRPRHAVQPRYAGLPDVLAVLMVVGLAVLAGTLIIPRLSIDLSPLKALQNVLPLSNSARRAIDVTVTPAPTTAAPTATPRPGVVERFAGTGVSVSSPNPAPNSQQSVVLRLRRDGQPAANFDVWSTVQYRTTEERWPPTGSVKTDASGAATITFNVGAPTPNYPVQVRVFVQADDQQLTWSTSFTPR